MLYKEYVLDQIGNKLERKNKYLLDLARADKDEFEKIKKNRDKHPYIIEEKHFLEEEKKFKESLKKTSIHAEDKAEKYVLERLEKAKKSKDFYEKYKDLSFDAELSYRTSLIEITRLEDLLAERKNMIDRKYELSQKLSKLDKDEIKRNEDLIASEKQTIMEDYKKDQVRLERAYKDETISQKAYKNKQVESKRAMKDKLKALELKNPRVLIEEELDSIKYKLDRDFKDRLRVLNLDISDLRRKIPVETEKTKPINSFLSFFLPGLGQLLNKQYLKALIFFLGSIFIFAFAIPYALGYGNYQGQGVAGLISLAKGGAKMDKSIIFMIEGIIAIILLVIALLIYYLSFIDVYTVEKSYINGVREKNWFETRTGLRTEGFPYLVSLPAFFVVTFIVIVPIITTILISFTNLDPSHQNKFSWVGIENYKLLTLGQGIAGQAFWRILFWTILWTLGATSLAIFIGFVLALLVNQERVKGKGVFRTIYILPWAVPAFISIMFFSLMVSRGGPITNLIESLTGLSVDIKNDTNLTRLCLILLQGWLGSAYIFLLTTGVLQGIPKDLYEAAEIDGATGLQRTLKITLPLVLYQTGPLLIGQYTFNFNNFSIIHLFNQGGPFNPSLYGNLAGSSDLLISYIYKLTLENQYQAVGAAITTVISIALMFVAYIGFRNTSLYKEE